MSAGIGTSGLDPEWTTAEQLARLLAPGKAKRAGREWETLCPAHDDHDPSLNITERNGKVLLCCQAGCPQDKVIDACRARGLWPDNSKTKARQAPHMRPNGTHTEEEVWEPIVPPPVDAPKPSDGQLRCDMLHRYLDADSRLLFYVRRHETRDGQGKQFYPLTWGTRDGKLGWHSKSPGTPLPLYGLDRLDHTSSATILLCEGEKSADAAQRMFPELVCMSWMGGAKKANQADLSPLTGHEVIIWPDADTPGRTAAAVLAEKLCVARVVDTTGLVEGFDAADLEHENVDPREWLENRLALSDARTKPAEPINDIGLITEGAVAEVFAAEHRDDLRFCHHTGSWFVWTGTRWKREQTKRAYRWAHEKAKTLAANKPKAIISAGKAAFAGGVERLAQSDPALAVTSEIWDTDPWLLGTPAGTVNLRTGKLYPATPADFITKLTAVAPADAPDCPRWLQFLDDATRSDAALIRFLQQWCGYCLSGDTREHALMFIFGPGRNGKSVFLNTVTRVLADYCRTAAMETFTTASGERHPTDLAMLKGARLVAASETEEGRAWAEVRIKQLTGGDTIAARFMRQDFFEFRPQFKLVVIGNHKPVLRNVDEAARRRFNVVPFIHKPAIPDKQLEVKLQAEWPGVLRWMIDGCLDWQMNGLIRPAVVARATNEYFHEQDTIRQWIEDCCDTTERPPHVVDTCASLFASWRNYALQQGEDPGSSKRLSTALKRSDYVPIKDELGVRGRGFRGLKVKVSAWREPAEDGLRERYP